MSRRRARGFTILELSVVLIIVLLLAATFPYALMVVVNTKYRRGENDAIAMVNGIVGSRDHNGTMGDLGWVPNPGELQELANGRPTFATRGNVRGVTYGWHGPYAVPGVGVGGANINGIVNDPWGMPWTIPATGGVSLSSTGPNRMPGASLGLDDDDIQMPATPASNRLGQVVVHVVDAMGRALDDGSVEVSVTNPSPTAMGTRACNWTGGRCTATDLWQGQHVVTVKGLAGTEYEDARGFARIYVGGGGISAVTVRLSLWERP